MAQVFVLQRGDVIKGIYSTKARARNAAKRYARNLSGNNFEEVKSNVWRCTLRGTTQWTWLSIKAKTLDPRWYSRET